MKRIILALLTLIVLAGVGAGGFWYLREQRVSAFAEAAYGGASEKIVDVKPGTGPKSIGALLEEKGVVSSAEDLYLLIRRENLGPKLKAGEYAFAGELTPRQVLEKLVRGEVRLYRFTIPEGLRAEEILPLLAASDLKLDLATLERLTESREFLKKAGVPSASIEGFLFPDTYSFARGATEEAVLRRMVQSALEAYGRAQNKRKPGITLDLMQTMTLASIVEKETGAVEERPRIACVFHNRLKNKDKLQTDPTVLYAMKLLRGKFVKNITKADLTTDHPYNTYTRKGLPPGPIANPGAAAIEAALNPLDCSDYFFVSRNDGTHIFCPTYACHEAAVEKWQRQYFRKKRAENGG